VSFWWRAFKRVIRVSLSGEEGTEVVMTKREIKPYPEVEVKENAFDVS